MSAGTASHTATYGQGTYPESVQSPGGREFPPASSAPRFSDTPQFPNGHQYPDGPQFPDGSQFPNGHQYPDGPQFPDGSQYPNGRQFPEGPQFPDRAQLADGQQFQATAMLHRPPQPGYDQSPGPGGYAGDNGPGGPVRPGRGRRRITDAFARVGSFTPGAGFAAARRSPEPADWDEHAGHRPPEAAERPARRHEAASPGKNRNRNRALVAGAGVLSVIAIGGVILAPKMLHKPDPGCTVYAGPALTAYDKAINDLNAQATQSRLSGDMSATISELTHAVAAAHDPTVKSALNALISQLRTVQADVATGVVPPIAVNALNAASNTADHAC